MSLCKIIHLHFEKEKQMELKNLKQSEKGFTLVELAVVMIIIGVLIGGVLKGQEMITNARVTSTASQLQSFNAAFNSFQDQFGGQIPGDMASASTRLPNCTNAVCAASEANSNGQIEQGLGSDVQPDQEAAAVFEHLNAAGYISGMAGNQDVLSIGGSHPGTPLGGIFSAGDGRAAQTGFDATNIARRPYITVALNFNEVDGTNAILEASQAFAIDQRLDDGRSTSGLVLGESSIGCRGGTINDDTTPGAAPGATVVTVGGDYNTAGGTDNSAAGNGATIPSTGCVIAYQM